MDSKPVQGAPGRWIGATARRQHRVVAARQLVAIGVSRTQIRELVRRGWLTRIHRGVYAVGPLPLTNDGYWKAAELACAPCALSHASGAALWGMQPKERGSPHVIVPRGRAKARRGVVVHTTTTLLRTEVIRHRGILVTTPARTLLDIAPDLIDRRLERAIREAQYHGILAPGELEAVIDAHPKAPGRGRLDGLAERLDPTTGIPRTVLEDEGLALCRRFRIRSPETNARVLGYRVDFLWRRERLILEVDGRDSHAIAAGFAEDRVRDARLAAAGYQVLRLARFQIRRQAEESAATIAAMLSQRALLPFPAA